jgi:hypothetical protein
MLMYVTRLSGPIDDDTQYWHPSFNDALERTVELVQVVLQLNQFNINVNPEKVRFPVVVIDRN